MRLPAQRGKSTPETLLKALLVPVLLSFSPFFARGQPGIEPYLRTGNALLQQGRYEEARREFARVTHEHPAAAPAFVLLGVAQMQLNDRHAARVSLRHALELDPRSVNALYNLGVLALDEDRPGEAITYLEKAARLGPASPELAVNLVRAHLGTGDRKGGLRVAENARKAFKDSPALHLALGNSFLAHGMASEAAASLKAASALAPSQPEILLPLADACLQLSDLSCANDALSKTGADTAEVHFLKGKAALLARRDDEGFQEIETAIQRAPGNLNYRLTLARYYQKYGQQQKAIAAFEQAEKLAPDAAEISYGLAVSYFIQDDFNRAAELSTRALRLNPGFDRAMFLLAISRFAKSQFREAEDLLGKALQLRPENAFYHCFQGMVRLATDRLSEASTSLREAIRLQPAYALAHYQLGRLLLRMRNYPEARTELEHAVSLQPDLGEAYYQLGLVYRHLGENQKAAAALAEFQRFRKVEESERAEILRQAQRSVQDKP